MVVPHAGPAGRPGGWGPLATKDLIRNKRASGRTQDLADLERLEGGDG